MDKLLTPRPVTVKRTLRWAWCQRHTACKYCSMLQLLVLRCRIFGPLFFLLLASLCSAAAVGTGKAGGTTVLCLKS